MLKDFYYQDDRREESARLMLDEADRATVSTISPSKAVAPWGL